MRVCARTTLLLAALLTGCASGGPDQFANYKGAPRIEPGHKADGGYDLTEPERKLDCKKLTGLIMVRIGTLRGGTNAPAPSPAAGALQSTVGKSLGYPTVGVDPKAEARQERVRIEALNRALADKGCRTVDIDKALAQPEGAPIPFAQPAKR